MRYFIIKDQKSIKYNFNNMNKIAYLVIVPLIITACNGSEEEKEKSASSLQSVNSAIIDVSQVVGVGKVEPINEIISLAAASGGIVKEVYKYDGDSIKKDEPLVRLDDELELIKISQLRSQYNAQKSQEDIEAIQLRESEAKLANKKKLLESVRALELKGAETTQTLDDLETEVTTLYLTVEKNNASLKLAGSRLRELAAQVRYAEYEASKKILRSPYEGIMLEMHIKKGSAVNQFEQFAEVAPSGPITVRTEIDELFAGRLREGLNANIRFIGSDSVIARGKIIFISPYLKKKSLFSQKADEQEDRLVREVRIKLEEDNGIILNSKVESEIQIKNN